MVDLDRVDPGLRRSLDEFRSTFPGGFHAISDIGQRRLAAGAAIAGLLAEAAPNPRVDWSDVVIAGPESSLTLRIYRPRGSPAVRPALLYIHGGGMIMGSVDDEHLRAVDLCDRLQIVIASLDYRKAPEHPYPAALRDCIAGAEWVIDHAAELGVDADNFGAFGGSAGGGLVLAVALAARDQGAFGLRFLMALCPMLDDRHETDSSREITDVGTWDRAASLEAWTWYLGGQEADEYAAPARATNLRGMPRTFIDVGELDLFRDEDMDFARRLASAGVPVEFHLYPGNFHGGESFAPNAALSQRIWQTRYDALQRFTAG